nr:protein qutg [Quercus suber]
MATADADLDGIYRFAIDVARGAARILHQAMLARCSGGDRVSTEHIEKESSVDLVTQTDEDVEAYIKQRVLEKYPSHKYVYLLWRYLYHSKAYADTSTPSFIGEESYSKGASRNYLIGKEPTWCVDPLDGQSAAKHLIISPADLNA